MSSNDNGLPVILRDWLTGRRASLLIIGAVVLLAGSLAMTRGTPDRRDSGAAAAPAADSSAFETGGETASDAAVSTGDSAQTSVASGDSAQFPSGPQLFALPPIEGGVARMKKPDAVRGLYLNAWAAGSSRKLDRLIDIANSTEINAFVIDVKEGGEISYPSQVPLVNAIDSDRQYIRDVRGMLAKLRANNIYPIARIVLFRDEVLAKARPDWSIRHRDGGEWEDAAGHRWVDSFNRDVWDYNIAIAREALELGFAEVQWDYVRFPDVPQRLMQTAVWPAQEGRTKADAVREFLLYSREQLAEYDVPVTADVFGLTVSVRNDMGIGQLWEKMSDATDVLLPMVYPSHYARGSYGIAAPNAQPYEIVKKAMEYAVRRSEGIENAAGIRPWLQDFTLGAPRYDAAHVRAQIDAVHDAGLTEWVLWHPGSNYTVEALASADGKAPQLPRPGAQPREETAPDAARDSTADAAPIGRPVPDSLLAPRQRH